MSFYGSSFIYSGINSELYDLRLFDFGTTSPVNSPAGGDASILEQWLYRRETPYFYGRYYQESLEFDFTVGSFSHIDGATRNAIESWLLGQSGYQQLRIVQGDMADIVYNIIITRSSHVFVGNLNYALTLHAKCDRPWGLYLPPVFTKTYPTGLMNDTFDYLNSSSLSGYNRPLITFTNGSTATFFSIVNHSDNDREFRFGAMSPLETITVDNDKGIITSSLGILRMNIFNKNFLRLVKGVNNLTLSGYITQFTLTAEFARIVGG